jgi:hypothetical protein
VAGEPENHTLRLLREMREEAKRHFDEMREETNRSFDGMNRRFDEMREEHASFRAEVSAFQAETRVGLAALSTDLKLTKATVESIHETQQNHGTRLNAIEGRLAIIEKHTGLVKT